MRASLPTAATLAALIAATLAAAPAHAGPLERAREAEARGDLRAVQIEYRNAAREDPKSATAQIALAAASLDVGDGITAEKAARSALDLNGDQAASTALLLRAYLAQGRFQDLLRDFPVQQSAPPAVAGQVAAGRALAQLATKQADAAKASVDDALRLAPAAPEPYLAKGALALLAGDRAAAEAATDEALAKAGNNAEALLRKASLQFGRRDLGGASETASRLLARQPGNIPARLLRTEAAMLLGDDAAATRDLDAALAMQPTSVPARYLRARLLAKAQKWKEVDEELERIAPALGNFPDAYLLQAAAKGALGQVAQAEDAARRYVARQPDDPRGAKLLASLELKAGRAEGAASTLAKLVERGKADAESYDLLGRAYATIGKPADAAAALERAAALAPGDSGILARLAAARLAVGDTKGTSTAAEESLRLQPAQPAVQEMLAAAAFTRGDIAAAEAELAKIGAQGKPSEPVGLLQGSIRLVRLDYAGARSAFEAVLRDYPNSIGARLALARVAALQGEAAEGDRLLAEVLQRNPTNGEALSQVANIAMAGGPRAAAARKALEAAQAAAPQEAAPALVLANVLIRTGAPADAIRVLDKPQFQGAGKGPALPFARAEAYAAQQRWGEAQASARTALAEQPNSVPARIQLAATLFRGGDPRVAEETIAEGLRSTPGDPALQRAALRLAKETRGTDGALAMADQLTQATAGQPGAGSLRAEVLAEAQRYDEAARAFAAAYDKEPSSLLAGRRAALLIQAGKPEEAAAALRAWLARDPADVAALSALSQLDISAGRYDQAERSLETVVGRMPNDPVALNNLAWLLDRKDATADRGRQLAERAFYLAPTRDTADTLGWILAKRGNPQQALPLLREAAAQGGQQAPTISYHLAYALRATGNREEASRVLTAALAGGQFPERADAERLMAELRSGR